MRSWRLRFNARAHGALAARSGDARKPVRRRAVRLEGLECRTLMDSGGLDPTFGTGGVVTTPVGTDAFVSSVAVEPDGKIVAAGVAKIGGQNEFALVRYNADGSLDASFGDDGIVTTAIGESSSQAYGVAVEPDGNIVAVGQSLEDSRLNMTLVRYKDDGSLDGSFGQGGIVTTPVGSSEATASSVAIQSDGRIVVAGSASDGFALVRYQSDGSLDSSFGAGGVDHFPTVPGFPGFTNASGVAIESNGKIVAVGGSGSEISVVRVNANGSVDDGFGEQGVVSQRVGYPGGAEIGSAVVVQPDGKIVIGGSVVTKLAAQPKPPAPPGSAQYDHEVQDPAYVFFGLERFNADGSLDTTFGDGGVVATKVAGGGDALDNLALLPDGRIVAAGGAEIDPDGANPQGVFAAAIYNPNGALDSNFADGGIFVSATGATQGCGLAATLDSAGDVLIGGAAGSDGQRQSFALARVTIDSTPSPASPPPPTSVPVTWLPPPVTWNPAPPIPPIHTMPPLPPSPPTPGGNSGAALVERLYQQFLNRSPDAAGLAYWLDQMAHGTSQSVVAADILSSTEYLDRAIGLDYQRLLDRGPDAQGLAFFTSAVQSGQMDLNQVAVDLLNSPEFSRKAGHANAAWVNSLYAHLLGRSADSAGAAAWAAALDDGSLTRAQVARDFVYSDENLGAQAVAWYDALVGQAPTAQETAQLAADLAAGQSQEAVFSEILKTSG